MRRLADGWRLLSARNYPNYLAVVVAALAVRDDGIPIARGLIEQFVLFGVCLYSGIYIVNAVLDADLDRQHPVKKHRPIAAGRIPRLQALAFVAVLWTTAFTFTDPRYRPLYGAFIGVNLVYSLFVKRHGPRNLIAVTAGMRVAVGCLVAGQSPFAHLELLLLATLFMAAVQQVKFSVEGTRGGERTGPKLAAIAAVMTAVGIWSASSQPLVVAWVAFAMVLWVLVPWRHPPFARWLIGADVPAPTRPTAVDTRGSLVAFDFDGTLCDSIRAILAAVNEKAMPYGFEPISEERFREFRGLSVRQIQKTLGLRAHHLVLLGRHARRSLYERREALEPIAGIPAALRALHEAGHRLAIVSSNNERNVKAFLRAHGIDLFDEIVTHRGLGSGLWGKGRQLEALRRASPGTAGFVYVCDEIRDVEAARSVGMPVVAVTWGANSAAALASAGPTVTIDNPRQLAAAVEQALAEAETQTAPRVLTTGGS